MTTNQSGTFISKNDSPIDELFTSGLLAYFANTEAKKRQDEAMEMRALVANHKAAQKASGRMTSQEFKAARIACGLTQEQMGELMGMKQEAICRIETEDRQPTKQQAATVALILKLHHHIGEKSNETDND